MTKKKIIMIVIPVIIILSLVGMGFLASMRKPPAKTPLIEQKRSVKVLRVKYSTIKSPVSGLGRLISGQEVILGSEVQGRILAGNVPLKKGQSFKEDDLLLKIYDQETRLGLLALKSNFLRDVASILPDFKIDFPESYENWQKFFNIININKTLPDLPPVKSDKEKIFLASCNILSEYYSILSQEELLKKYNIYAPFDGTFTSVSLEVGATANLGSTLATIIRTDNLELEVSIELSDAKWIKVGDKVVLSTEKGDEQWTGRCVRKSDFVDPATQSIAVFVSVDPDINKPLYKGQYLSAAFPGAELSEAMEIPRNAVFNYNQVFVVNDNRLKKREIKILKINQYSIVFRGLEEGLYIVSEPQVNAVENTLVEMIN